jgi:deoxyribodipyrimidine photolyase-related protein
MKTAFIILPNQLFRNIDILINYDSIYIVEESLFFGDSERIVNFNKLKLVLHRGSMKYYHELLSKKNINSTYINYSPDSICKLFIQMKKDNVGSIQMYDPIDHLFHKRLLYYCQKYKIKLLPFLDSPNFINTYTDLMHYYREHQNDKRQIHDSFYRYMRKYHKILLDEYGNFLGGKASYDTDNRKTISKKDIENIPTLIKKPSHVSNKEKVYLNDAISYVEQNFPNNYGNTFNTDHIAFTHDTADLLLNDFLENRLIHFGDYQDAFTNKNPFLYHSNLSHAINVGLLDPIECIEKAIEKYNSDKRITINNVEGFVRQILGWREYTRYLYVFFYDRIKNGNFMQSSNLLTSPWYNGTTGWKPIDDCIKQAFQYGYLHHIQRLMLIGNIMNLMKFHPDEVYRWFMEFAIDSYDWVMISNVYSMILFADGGFTTSKPYISGSNYLVKMSNGEYKKDGKWDTDMDTLFYNYIGTAPMVSYGKSKKINYFDANPRTKLMYRLWVKKIESGESKKILENASNIFNTH